MGCKGINIMSISCLTNMWGQTQLAYIVEMQCHTHLHNAMAQVPIQPKTVSNIVGFHNALVTCGGMSNIRPHIGVTPTPGLKTNKWQT